MNSHIQVSHKNLKMSWSIILNKEKPLEIRGQLMFCIFHSAKMCNAHFETLLVVDFVATVQIFCKESRKTGPYQCNGQLSWKLKETKLGQNEGEKQADLSVGGRREAARGIDCPPSSPLLPTKPSHILGAKLSPNLHTFKLSFSIVIKLPFWNALNTNNRLPSPPPPHSTKPSHILSQIVTKLYSEVAQVSRLFNDAYVPSRIWLPLRPSWAANCHTAFFATFLSSQLSGNKVTHLERNENALNTTCKSS